jgi:hypothetical protein
MPAIETMPVLHKITPIEQTAQVLVEIRLPFVLENGEQTMLALVVGKTIEVTLATAQQDLFDDDQDDRVVMLRQDVREELGLDEDAQDAPAEM